MKKQIVLATIATLATTSAYATRARMQALGQDADRGSFYLKDTRTVFRNAAHINGMNNYMVTEWGEARGQGDATDNPNAEGGFFRNAGSFNYGVYLGADLDSQNDTRRGGNGYANAVVMGETDFVERDNELDLFIGGDMGVEWGARLHYANGKEETGTFERKQSSLGLGLGVVMGDLDVYANIGLSDESEGGDVAADKWEGDTSIDAGLAYNWMDYTFFANYNTDGGKYTNGTAAAVETSRTDLTIGAGYVKEVSSTSRMIADISYFSRSAEDKNATGTAELNTSALPVTIGFETDATSWLTLRGSISQRVLINSVETKTIAGATTKATGTDTTDVEAGMTLNFGKLMIDGVIGNTGPAGDITAANDERGVLSLDRLATRVAVHYWF